MSLYVSVTQLTDVRMVIQNCYGLIIGLIVGSDEFVFGFVFPVCNNRNMRTSNVCMYVSLLTALEVQNDTAKLINNKYKK